MDKLIIAMNKCDMFPQGVDDPALQANTKKLRARFKNTKFGAFLPIVHVSAAPKEGEAYGVETLIMTILENIEIPNRDVSKKPLLFSIDHCFQIKG